MPIATPNLTRPGESYPRRLNIMLLIPQYTYGGAERVFFNQGRELARHHRVIECVFDQHTPVDFPTQNTLVFLDVPAGQGTLGKVQSFRQRIERVRQLKREYQIDVCISHLEGADYLNVLSKGREKIILCMHNTIVRHPNTRGLMGALRVKGLVPKLYRRADAIAAVSRDLRRELIESFGLPADKAVTINNFFDFDTIRQRSQETLPSGEEALFAFPTLISTARLAHEKNQLGLLAVFAALRAQGQPELRLLILGDGPMREPLLAQSRELGFRTWQVWAEQPLTPDYDVFFLGFQSNPFRYIGRSTVFVLSSSAEGFPMALCEAMACGVPVVSTDCPTGPREILAPTTSDTTYTATPEWADYGLLLPMLGEGANLERTAPLSAAAIAGLLDDPAKRTYYAAQAQTQVQNFGPVPIMRQWEDLIQKVVSQ